MRLNSIHILAVCMLLLASSCRKFVEVGAPRTSLIGDIVYSKEATATAAVLDIYFSMRGVNSDYSVTFTPMSALYTDEWQMHGTAAPLQECYLNALQAANSQNEVIWTKGYEGIYKANSALEGITADGAAIPAVTRNQLLGEAKFLRAFIYFHLINVYGDVPLLLTTNYQQNMRATRTPVAQVYQQIVADMKEARELVRDEYLTGANAVGTDRIRVNKSVITAALARVYLFMENWSEAETAATAVINDNARFTLANDLTKVFDITSKEAIFQIASPPQNNSTPGSDHFFLTGNPTTPSPQVNFGSFNSRQLAVLRPGDARRTQWVATFAGTNGITYYYSKKYRSITYGDPPVQYHTIIRLAELYLIRAEARLQQPGKEALGIADINVIRTRAREAASVEVPDPLPALSTTMTKQDAMLALEEERRMELFLEGHRWVDMKRWKGFNNSAVTRADEIMPGIAAAKGGIWDANRKLWPLPLSDVRANPAMGQNDGYDR